MTAKQKRWSKRQLVALNASAWAVAALIVVQLFLQLDGRGALSTGLGLVILGCLVYMFIWTGRFAERPNGRTRSGAKIALLALAVVLTVLAGVVINAGLRSWQIDAPTLAQGVLSIALAAGGALWFWTWCGLYGWQLSRQLRISGTGGPDDGEARDKLTQQCRKTSRRATFMKAHLPLAGAAVLVGFLVLLF